MGNIKELQSVEIARIKPYKNNAKIHGRNQLKKLQKSISEFGFLTPCLIDQDFNLIAGHGRVEAAKALGMKEVPCVYIENLNETQRRAYILADNRLGELGEWDMELVESELRELEELDFDIDLTGFDLGDFKCELPTTEEDDYSCELPEEPNSKPGDLYKLGNHRLICGDSFDVEIVKKLTGGGMWIYYSLTHHINLKHLVVEF